MDATSKVCHVVAMLYPGRDHINPMINLCKLLAAKKNDVAVFFDTQVGCRDAMHQSGVVRFQFQWRWSMSAAPVDSLFT
ncbi:hypothetical protein ACFX2A_013668 [Malus domestica]